MNESAEQPSPKNEPDLNAELKIISNNVEMTIQTETTSCKQANENADKPLHSKNCLNLISSEEKQYDNCHEIVDIYEQESKQQLIITTSTNRSENANEPNRQENALPVELSASENDEELLKSNEVLSNTFDTSFSSEYEDAVSSPTYETSETHSKKCNHNDDTETCLTRKCTVSLPNIDNLLSHSDENGRTDVSKMNCTVENEQIENVRLNDQNIAANVFGDRHSIRENIDNQEPNCSSYYRSLSSHDHGVWNRLPNTAVYDEAYPNYNCNIDINNKSSLKRANCSTESSITPNKKSKKGITFDSVSVYYFPRTQGFTCIPSQGGSTLGMSWNHSHIRKFSLGEHAAEQRRAHRQFCSQQFSNSRNWNEMSTISSEDSDSDEIISDSEMDYENYNFLQPIPTKERRAMLRAAGIHKIDSAEKDECRSIRSSRELCGCTCQIYCDPERCVCAQAGIKCQVDRMNFPCSCTREGCANENGRIEFNPVRVRTHYIHTLMRLEMEKKKEEEEQRNKLILSNLESNSQLSYSASSLDLAGNNLMNFSYHNDLQSYYMQPPVSYGASTTSSIVNSCFNFTYASNSNQFVIPSTAASIEYRESVTDSNMRLGASNSSQMDYRCALTAPASNSARIDNYADNELSKEPQNHQNFVIRDLTNGSQSNDANVPYSSQSLMQLADENFAQNAENVNTDENLDTSVEETEKEESDSENFGNIIKKTMVESVIA